MYKPKKFGQRLHKDYNGNISKLPVRKGDIVLYDNKPYVVLCKISTRKCFSLSPLDQDEKGNITCSSDPSDSGKYVRSTNVSLVIQCSIKTRSYKEYKDWFNHAWNSGGHQNRFNQARYCGYW